MDSGIVLQGAGERACVATSIDVKDLLQMVARRRG
jgi:hypothetical protein